ncbi:MAG: hypothetical protein QOG19_3046, partial [Mycobacterium sp.]|nr:hypothetical protein [Mycobacterium sp.]
MSRASAAVTLMVMDKPVTVNDVLDGHVVL